MIEWVVAGLLALVLLPIMVFVTVKWGTYAVLIARWRFDQEHNQTKGEENDGNDQKGTGQEGEQKNGRRRMG